MGKVSPRTEMAHAHWQGMPEYANEDKTPDRQLIISFRNAEDFAAFEALVGQKMTNKTKSIWYPANTIEKFSTKSYEDCE